MPFKGVAVLSPGRASSVIDGDPAFALVQICIANLFASSSVAAPCVKSFFTGSESSTPIGFGHFYHALRASLGDAIVHSYLFGLVSGESVNSYSSYPVRGIRSYGPPSVLPKWRVSSRGGGWSIARDGGASLRSCLSCLSAYWVIAWMAVPFSSQRSP